MRINRTVNPTMWMHHDSVDWLAESWTVPFNIECKNVRMIQVISTASTSK